MRPREGTLGLRFEKHPRTSPYEVLVEQPLVKAPLPPPPVERVERLAALLDPREAVARPRAPPVLHEPLQRIPGMQHPVGRPRPLGLYPVVRLVERRVGDARQLHAHRGRTPGVPLVNIRNGSDYISRCPAPSTSKYHYLFLFLQTFPLLLTLLSNE